MYQRTPIENAVRQNSPDIVQLLLDAGADINHKDMTDRTPLGLAVESNAVQIAKILIDNGADVNVPYGGKGRRITVTDWGLIHAAAWGPYPEIADLLLRKGVKHDVHSAAGLGDVAVLIKLLEDGADLESKRVDGRTALHWAAMNGQTDAVQLLLDRGAAIDATDVADRTPLYQAAAEASAENRAAAKLLIDSGAEATVFDAAAAGHMEKLELLIEEGLTNLASVDVRGKEQDAQRIDPSDGEAYTKAEFIELYDGSEEEWNAAEPYPQESNHGPAGTDELATQRAIDSVVDVRNHKGETPLMVAAKSNQVNAVKTLLQHGANVNAIESHGDTALVICADTLDSLDSAEVLIDHGGLGISGFCRRQNHERGRAAMAALVAEYFRRIEHNADSKQTKRKELENCLKTRAGRNFFLDDTVGSLHAHFLSQSPSLIYQVLRVRGSQMCA